jgi:hypothetical protein
MPFVVGYEVLAIDGCTNIRFERGEETRLEEPAT